MCVCVKHTTNAQTRTIHTWPVLRNIVSCMLKRRRKCRHSRKWQININSLLSSLTYAIWYFYTERKVVYTIKWKIFFLKIWLFTASANIWKCISGSLWKRHFEKEIFSIVYCLQQKIIYYHLFVTCCWQKKFGSEFNTGLMIYFFAWLGQHLPSHFWVVAIYFYDTRIYIFWM